MYLCSLPQRRSRDQQGGGESTDGLGLGQARGGLAPSQPAQESRSQSRPGRNLRSKQFHVDLPGPRACAAVTSGGGGAGGTSAGRVLDSLRTS